MLENCLSHISSLEARVAELERRPVVVPPPEQVRKGTPAAGTDRTRFVEEWVKEEWIKVATSAGSHGFSLGPDELPEPFFSLESPRDRRR